MGAECDSCLVNNGMWMNQYMNERKNGLFCDCHMYKLIIITLKTDTTHYFTLNVIIWHLSLRIPYTENILVLYILELSAWVKLNILDFNFAVFWMLYAFFWVIPWRLNFI